MRSPAVEGTCRTRFRSRSRTSSPWSVATSSSPRRFSAMSRTEFEERARSPLPATKRSKESVSGS